jgi:acyl dehydratase
MTNERYLEDIHAGDRFQSAEQTVAEDAIVRFAREFDPQPFHVDADAARRTMFGGLIASGWHTAAIAMRLRLTAGVRVAGGLIGIGIEDIRWPRPVRPGDTLHLEGEVVDVRPSQSHPDYGVVRVRETALNQRNEPVMTMVTSLWVPRRPAR